MSEMVNRVARAIFPDEIDLLDGTQPGHEPGRCPECDDRRAIKLSHARAAIAAMSPWLKDGAIDSLDSE